MATCQIGLIPSILRHMFPSVKKNLHCIAIVSHHKTMIFDIIPIKIIIQQTPQNNLSMITVIIPMFKWLDVVKSDYDWSSYQRYSWYHINTNTHNLILKWIYGDSKSKYSMNHIAIEYSIIKFQYTCIYISILVVPLTLLLNLPQWYHQYFHSQSL